MSEDSLHDLISDPALSERYEVESLIGSGAFGDVYAARQVSTGQRVAVKIQSQRNRDEGPGELPSNFRAEMRVCGQLFHPNIVNLIDFGESHNGSAFVVLEYVPGKTLGEYLSNGPLSLEETRHLMMQALDALACAHAQDIAHRDLKPANIMIMETGAQPNAKVLDFGLAVATQGTTAPRTNSPFLYGSPAYCAPEQLHGAASTSSDLYSWGLIFLECLTGRPVFDSSSLQEVFDQQMRPDPIAVPTWLPGHDRRLLIDVTHKDPSQRCISAAEALERLRQSVFVARKVSARTDLAPDRPTRIWALPPRNRNFTGRAEAMAKVTRLFERKKSIAVTALHGLGGIGKSQIALEYAHEQTSEYDLIAWLRAESPETLGSDIAELAAELDLPERDEPAEERRIDAVRGWLESHDHWLLVFDNAPNVEAIRRQLPHNPGGRVLITSRSQQWRGVAEVIEIDGMTPSEASEFLMRRTGDTDAFGAEGLAAELGHLPLALEEAAAYIESTSRSFPAYVGLFREHRTALLREAEPPSDHPTTVQATLELGLKAAAKISDSAVDLVRVCSLLAPDRIPLSLVRRVLAKLAGTPQTSEGEDAVEIRMGRAIAALTRYSLISVADENIGLHRLVQLISRDAIPEELRRRIVLSAAEAVEESFPRSGLEGEMLPENATLAPHAMALLDHARGDEPCAPAVAGILSHLGSYLSGMGRPRYGGELLKEAIALYEGLGDEYERRRARATLSMGLAQYALVELPDALETCTRAVHLHEQAYGSGDLRIVQILHYSTLIRFRLGRFAEASESVDRCIETLSGLGPDNPLAAAAHGINCRLRYRMGDITAAMNSLDSGLAYFDANPVEHPFFGDPLGHIALMLNARGDLARAEACANTAVKISLPAYGTGHPLVAAATAARGLLRHRMGQTRDAIVDLDMALEGGERYATVQHEDVSVARAHLVEALVAVADLDRAARELLRAEESVGNVGGDTSRLVAAISLAKARLALSGSTHSAAVEAATASVQIHGRAFGPNHPAVAEPLVLQGEAFLRAKSTSDAAPAFVRALALLRPFAGPHLERAQALFGLGRTESLTGDAQDGTAHKREALELASRVLPEDHDELARMRDELA